MRWTLTSCSHIQDRASDEIKAARRDGVSVSELTARFIGGQAARQIRPTDNRHQFLNAAKSGRIIFPSEEDGVDIDGDEGISAELHGTAHLTPIDECRSQSGSAWLHFPHIELLFLLFAFEGAVASEASAIRQGFDTGEPSWVCYAAVVAVVRTGTVMST